MKRIYLAIGLTLMLFPKAFAMEYVTWRASHTATADTNQRLCPRRTAIFGGICVNDSGSQSGTISVFDSSSTATNAFAVIRATSSIAAGCSFYEVQTSSGLTYTNNTAGNDITILYQCY